jgi:hypothetical protein
MRTGIAVRLLSLAWSAVLIGLMATGTLSTARIGSISWGPTHEIWSAAIAISHIKFHLSGELAYKEVAQAIADEVTSTKNATDIMDDATRRLDNDPAAVTRGLQAAAAVQRANIAIPANKKGYVTDWVDDVGYADFYELAFRLFGFNAFSTHWLYFSVLLTACILFAGAFFNDSVAIGSLTLSITALFLISSSAYFQEVAPSFAANRFLSTLAIVPLLHSIHTSLRQAPLLRWEIIVLAAQTLIMSFAIAARAAGVWCVMAAVACAFVVIVVRRIPAAKRKTAGAIMTRLLARFASPYAGRVVATGAIVATVFAAAMVIRTVRIDELYYRDYNYPHHLVWHAAYLGLAWSPQWDSLRPHYADVDPGGDNSGFDLFIHVMKERGEPPLTEGYLFNYLRARPYEVFIRHQYLNVLARNPAFSVKLFLYYKPMAVFKIVARDVATIPALSWLLTICSLSLSSLCFAFGGSAGRLKELLICCAVVWLVSLFPVIWAYPIEFATADQLWSSLFLPMMLIGAAGQAIARGAFFGNEAMAEIAVERHTPVALPQSRVRIETDSQTGSVMRQEDIIQFAVKTCIVAVVISACGIFVADWIIKSVEASTANTISAVRQQLAPTVGGRQFWIKIKEQLDNAAAPSSDLPPEEKQKLLNDMRVIVSRWRPFIDAAQDELHKPAAGGSSQSEAGQAPR